MKYFKMSLLVSLLFLTPLAQAEQSWCLETYSKHIKASHGALIASGVTGGAATGITLIAAAPFAIIPLAITGGVMATAAYYKKQYEKAYALIVESNPDYQKNYKYVLRVAKSAKLPPGQTAQIIWKNESSFCKGKTPWTYRTIRKAIKKRKISL